MKKIFLITVFFISFVACKTTSKLNNQKDNYIPKLELINNNKWYCFYVHDIELNSKYTYCAMNDSTYFRKYYEEERYLILDTLDWGVIKN